MRVREGMAHELFRILQDVPASADVSFINAQNRPHSNRNEPFRQLSRYRGVIAISLSGETEAIRPGYTGRGPESEAECLR